MEFYKNESSNNIKNIEDLFNDKTSKNIKNSISKASEKYHSKEQLKKSLHLILSTAASIAILISIFLFNNSSQIESSKLFDTYIKKNNIPSLIDRGSNTDLLKA